MRVRGVRQREGEVHTPWGEVTGASGRSRMRAGAAVGGRRGRW